jgi:hypothetical protein
MTAGLEGKGQPIVTHIQLAQDILFSLRHRMADISMRAGPRPMGRLDVLERQIHALTEAVAEELAERLTRKT